MTPLNVDVLKQSIVQQAQNGVIDVVIELNRLDQRLADIADWIPLPVDSPIERPQTAPEYLFSTIEITRGEQFPELIGLLKSAAQETTASLWRAFAEEHLAETPEELFERPAPIAKYLRAQYGESDHELVGALYLDAGHRLIADVELCRGTPLVDPRVVLRQGLLLGAVALVLWHMHPDADSKPSDADLRITNLLAQASAAVGLRLVDHIVIGHGDEFTSIAGLN